ncbi:MAG: chorismate lyase [Pseudomonadota bacterium]|nr:chorismate lyase [Pseudomonadota bacterium]
MRTGIAGTPWLRRHLMHLPRMPAEMRDWLLDPASLTARLKAVCSGNFRVDLLEQRHLLPRPCEAADLGISPGRYALVRQVRLLCDREAWVFARTVIPEETLRGPQRRLRYLKTRPLGEVLFSSPTLTRARVTIERLVPGGALYALAASGIRRNAPAIWGRRSLFVVGGKRLLVSEYFLPGIPPCRP